MGDDPMLGIVTLLWLGLTLYALLDVLLGDAAEQRVLPKAVWALVVLLVPLLGPIAWFVVGRPTAATRRQDGTPASHGGVPDDARRDHPAWGTGPRDRTRRRSVEPRTGGGRRPGRAPRGPDDDPEFLRELDERLRRQGDEP
jgi:hypothetical protein